MVEKGQAILKLDPPDKIRKCLSCPKPECTNCIDATSNYKRVARWRQKQAEQERKG